MQSIAMLHSRMEAAPAGGKLLAGTCILMASVFPEVSNAQAIQMTRDNPDEDVRHFQSGVTSGDTDLINDDIGLAGCVDLADNSLDRYCAVNWVPGRTYHDRYGYPIVHGSCSAVEHPCGTVMPQPGTKTRPLVTAPETTHVAVTPAVMDHTAAAVTGQTAGGIPLEYQSGMTSGRTDLLDDDVTQAGCADLADNHVDWYCAVNWTPGRTYHDAAGNPTVHGSCSAVEHPCGAVVAEPGSMPRTGVMTRPLTSVGGAPAPASSAKVDSVCGMDDLAHLFSQIQEVCCTAQGEDCSSAPPRTCGDSCRVVMELAWHSSDCKEVLISMPGSSITAFADSCFATETRQAGAH